MNKNLIIIPYFEKDLYFIYNDEKMQFSTKDEILDFISYKFQQENQFVLLSKESIDRDRYDNIVNIASDRNIILNINSIRASYIDGNKRVQLYFTIKGISSFSMILYKYEENSIAVQIVLNDNHLLPSYIYKCKENETFEKDFYTIFLNRIYKFQQTFLD